MRFSLVLATLILSGAPAQAETLYYGSRAGMEVTVVKKSNLGSTHAKILTKHTKANATAYCREYIGEATAKCVAEGLKMQFVPEISANCRTGKFMTFSGQGFQFLGPNPDYDPTGGATEFLLVEAGGSEPLDGTSASGYDTAIGQFRALCPNRVAN